MLHTEELSMRMIRLASAVAMAAVFSTFPIHAAAQIVVGGETIQMPPPGAGHHIATQASYDRMPMKTIATYRK